jgi:integrase
MEMKAKFTLRARLTDGSFETVEFRKNAPVVPKDATRFYIRFSANGKRSTVPAGDNLDQAVTLMKNMELRRHAESCGIALPESIAPDRMLPDQIDKYLAEFLANNPRKTWLAYKNSLAKLSAVCRRPTVADITREDLLAFKAAMRTEGLSARSVVNNWVNVMSFLKAHDVHVKVQSSDTPKFVEREPEAYTPEEIQALLKAANREDRLKLNSFLCSGIRNAELAHLTYGDIDFKTSVWTIRPKEGWSPKSQNSQRFVPVAAWVTKQIEERMKAGGQSKGDLIFANHAGKPDMHMLRDLEAVAEAAGVTGRVDIHKFRSTAITTWLSDGVPPHKVMAWVGHKNLDVIMRYVAMVNTHSKETQELAAHPFAQYAGVGD